MIYSYYIDIYIVFALLDSALDSISGVMSQVSGAAVPRFFLICELGN